MLSSITIIPPLMSHRLVRFYGAKSFPLIWLPLVLPLTLFSMKQAFHFILSFLNILIITCFSLSELQPKNAPQAQFTSITCCNTEQLSFSCLLDWCDNNQSEQSFFFPAHQEETCVLLQLTVVWFISVVSEPRWNWKCNHCANHVSYALCICMQHVYILGTTVNQHICR